LEELGTLAHSHSLSMARDHLQFLPFDAKADIVSSHSAQEDNPYNALFKKQEK
jgi:hypothetical protein